MTSYNYYAWPGPGPTFPLGYPYVSQSQGLNLSAATGNPSLSGPSLNVGNLAAANSAGKNGVQPSESEDDLVFVNMEVKGLSPQNKKDYHMYTLQRISRDVDSPEKLKAEIYEQCKDVVPSPQTMVLSAFQEKVD